MRRETLDILVAEKVMGVNLKPSREFAMAMIGRKYISVTGPVFTLTTGEELKVPPGRELRQPEGSTDWNDRYYLYVAEHLEDQISKEIEEYRLAPRRYSSDIQDAWLVAEKLKLTVTPGWKVFQANTSGFERDKQFIGTTNNQTWVEHESAPMAICLAALKSIGLEVTHG